MTQKVDYIYSPQLTLFGTGERDCIGFGCNEFYVQELNRDVANKIIIENHYSHKIYAATYIHLGCYINGKLLGVLQFGYSSHPASQGGVVEGTAIDEYLELNRMWFDDSAQKNTESRAISYAIKYIKKKFKSKIKWIQSFADERCGGLGIVYQACNFKYYGEHLSDFWEYEGEVFHNVNMTCKNPKRRKGKVKELQENKDKATRLSLRQFRYLFFIDKRYEKKCLLKEVPYLKHYNGD